MLTPIKSLANLDPDSDKETEISNNLARIHPVSGYSDDDNMWVKLGNLDKVAPCSIVNDKSSVIIQVSGSDQ